MYEISLSPQSEIADRAGMAAGPDLFDEISPELGERGRPWSPSNPPLADVLDSKLAGLPAPTKEPIEAAPAMDADVQSQWPSDDGGADESLAEVEPTSAGAQELREQDAVQSPTVLQPTIASGVSELTAGRLKTTPSATCVMSSAEQVQPAVAGVSPPSSSCGFRQPAGKTSPVPKRIGSGRLVPARLTWKPRDPFAVDAKPRGEHFRWDVMLTSACVTAVFGLGCVWLLRTLLA